MTATSSRHGEAVTLLGIDLADDDWVLVLDCPDVPAVLGVCS